MFRNAVLVAFMAVAFGSTAHATTLDVILGQTAKSSYQYTTGGTLTPDIDLSNTPDLSLSKGSGILGQGTSFPGLVTSPKGKLYDQEYLFVSGGKSTSATFTLASNGSTFGLTWGAIEPYNTLLVTSSNGVTYKITGAEILNHICMSDPGVTQENVIINDPFGNIVQVVLESGKNSFEAANFYADPRAVPLPGAALLFGMGLVGLTLVSRRNRDVV